MPAKEFLETYPLYRKFSMKFPIQLHEITAKPPIIMTCDNCNETRTFRMIGEYYDYKKVRVVEETSGDFTQVKQSKGYKAESEIAAALKTADAVSKIEYLCTHCVEFKITFMVKFSAGLDYIVKIGQDPAWSINVDKKLVRMLGDKLPIYKKGLISESQAYGIGAYAYYRKVVEAVIDDLLKSLKPLIEEGEKEEYSKAIEQVESSKVAQDKIELVKDLLPIILRPDGMNPLNILHDSLSKGLHSESDEECIEYAQQIREVMEFLINQIADTEKTRNAFTDNMRKLLEKRNKS